MDDSRWLEQVPKVELHVHSDGACRLETLRDLSLQYNLPYPHDDLEAFKKVVTLSGPQDSLVDFLKPFAAIGNILRTRAALERIAYEFCEDMHRQNVVYAEYRFHPCFRQSVSEGRISGRDYCDGIFEGLERGEKEFGVKVRCIICFIRSLPENTGDVVKLAEHYMKENKWLVGVDIAGDELQPMHPEHVKGFHEARSLGLKVTAHAGESGPAKNVKEAIDVLGAQRIGHGYHVIEDDQIYSHAKEKKIHFEVCPTSSIFTNSASIDNHAIHDFIRDDVSFGLNTDDPGVMNCSMNGEFKMAREQLKLTRDQIKTSVLNAAKASFLPDDEKQDLVRIIKEKMAALDKS